MVYVKRKNKFSQIYRKNQAFLPGSSPLAGIAVILIKNQIVQIYRRIIAFMHLSHSLQKTLPHSICAGLQKMCRIFLTAGNKLSKIDRYISICPSSSVV